jgi:uncharacterized protein YbcI
MTDSALSMAQRIAAAAHDFQLASTGRSPASVTVALSGDTLVITFHEALSVAEKAMAQTPDGAAQVQEFHRQLFLSSVASMRNDIQRITGVEVHVFQLAGVIPAEEWKADGAPRLA